MSERFSGGAIVVSEDTSEAARILGGRQVLDFSLIRRDPHEVNAGAVATALKGAAYKHGENDPNEYAVLFAGPDKVTVSPRLSDAARLALTGYFGVEVVNNHPVLEAVS